MKIWYGTLIVTTVVLTSYLVNATNKNIPAISQNIVILKEQIAKQNILLEALQTEIKSLTNNKGTTTPSKPSEEDKRKIAIESLRTSFAKIAEAEAKHKQGDLNSAVDILKSTKELLWKAGDILTAQQEALRGLMSPIDLLIGQWKKGDKTAEISKISSTVKTILQKLDSHS